MGSDVERLTTALSVLKELYAEYPLDCSYAEANLNLRPRDAIRTTKDWRATSLVVLERAIADAGKGRQGDSTQSVLDDALMFSIGTGVPRDVLEAAFGLLHN